jgi:preprotein translocase subunit SecG
LTSTTGWLSAVFFATSFGLAMIADQQYAETDDLGFEVPLGAIEAAPLAPAGDLPLADEPNENSGSGDLPID